jgi:NADH:ubiquinone oxidoreductase subunit 6 (subunit J)
MTVYRYLAEGLFFAFVVLIFFGGILAVRARILMYTVLGLIVALVGVAGLYFHLGSPFLAMMQVLIYVGAVCIMIVFGIMVGHTPTQAAARQGGRRNLWLAVGACSAGFALLVSVVLRTLWVPAAERQGDFSLEHLGQSLLYQYCLAFELISVILLTAIVGAIILARSGKEESPT